MAEAPLLERATRLQVFSLRTISLINFSTNILCNNQELSGLITKCVYQVDVYEKVTIKNGKAYKNVHDKVYKLVSKMRETVTFRDIVLEILWLATYRILRWKFVYASFIDDEFLQYFHWTWKDGRIDNKTTARYILENQMIPVVQRFMLACILCLTEEIYDLFSHMSFEDHHGLLTEDTGKIYPLLQYWVSELENDDNTVRVNFRRALFCAVNIGSIEAVKYFFSIMTEREKSAKAILCSYGLMRKLNRFPFLEEDESDMGYFLFSQMTEADQITFFNSYSSIVQLFLLYSPGQKVFLEVFKAKCGTASRRQVKNMLVLIFYKIYLNVFKDYNYYELFIIVWEMSDDSFKKYLREIGCLEGWFCTLISNHFRFLLHKRPKDNKKRWNVSAKLFRFNQDRWQLLLFCIKNEIVTMQSLTSHKPRLLKLLRTRKCNKHAWRRLMKFISDYRPKNHK